jgi:hypothetical protein
MSTTVGSAVLPASARRRLRTIQKHAFSGGGARDTQNYQHFQALDVGAQAFAARARLIGARPMPHAVAFWPDTLWRSAPAMRGLQQAPSDVLEVVVRFVLLRLMIQSSPAAADLMW